ncbi:hypothetical protein CDD81_279 [Ophiocordyceps australis]|uniref:Uncharacterized protein n=1 Tax=Ophiocordyceps australis TaxID=1399860 RepID=A0A2C5Y2S5_9HYPO|nr:hypothetical protein CDD81_279 [Ophiocordyceps australis]
MEGIQLSQVLADLSNIGAAEPGAAATIARVNMPSDDASKERDARSQLSRPPTSQPQSQMQQQQQQRPSSLTRALSSEPGYPPKFDKMGRRIFINSPGSRPGSAAGSGPGTPRRGDSDVDDEWERASVLMALYDIRAKIKEQDHSSLVRAREKINAIAAKQQAQQAAERNLRTAEELRRNRYSFPKPGL